MYRPLTSSTLQYPVIPYHRTYGIMLHFISSWKEEWFNSSFMNFNKRICITITFIITCAIRTVEVKSSVFSFVCYTYTFRIKTARNGKHGQEWQTGKFGILQYLCCLHKRTVLCIEKNGDHVEGYGAMYLHCGNILGQVMWNQLMWNQGFAWKINKFAWCHFSMLTEPRALSIDTATLVRTTDLYF
jgi:hypothetical protein